MSTFTIRQLKVAILEVLATSRNGHRYNMLGGRGDQRGDLERHLSVTFGAPDRQRADWAFGQLLNDGLISPTYADLVDPASWVEITESGRDALRRGVLDSLDEALRKISPHLVEVRDGAWAAIASSRPDAARQAAHSARELIEQTLKEGAPDDTVRSASWFRHDPSSKTGITRRQRLRYLMEKHLGEVSDTDLTESDAAAGLVFASDARLQSLSHARAAVSDLDDVRGTLHVAEAALRRVLIRRA
jgi:hypothetical protein